MLLLIFLVLPAGANPFLGSSEQTVPQVATAGQTRADLAEKQLDLRNRMANIMLDLKESGSGRFHLFLYGMAFLYGMLHASGPGHRKTIVFSLYLGKESRPLEPLAMGLLLSLLHGGSAVFLVLLFKSLTGPLFSQSLNNSTLQMEGWAYSLLTVISFFLVISAVRHAGKGHIHDHTAGRRSFWAIAMTGFFPCPGAIMILVFTLTHQMLSTGILAIAAMSLGMALPVSLAGYLAYYGKKGVFRLLKDREHLIGKLSSLLEISGFSLLFLLSFYMAFPFISRLV